MSGVKGRSSYLNNHQSMFNLVTGDWRYAIDRIGNNSVSIATEGTLLEGNT